MALLSEEIYIILQTGTAKSGSNMRPALLSEEIYIILQIGTGKSGSIKRRELLTADCSRQCFGPALYTLDQIPFALSYLPFRYFLHPTFSNIYLFSGAINYHPPLITGQSEARL